MVRFSPGCECCEDEPQVCKLCDPNEFLPDPHSSTQQEYDLIFWEGNPSGNETTITVQGPTFQGQDGNLTDPFGCCSWGYVGEVGDIPGIISDRGDCSTGDVLTVTLQLCRIQQGLETRWYWAVTIRIECDTPQTGPDKGTASWGLDIEPTVPGLTANCDLDTLDPDPFHVLELSTTCAYNDCPGEPIQFPHGEPCINCDHCDLFGPVDGCDFPEPQTVKVENAQGNP